MMFGALMPLQLAIVMVSQKRQTALTVAKHTNRRINAAAFHAGNAMHGMHWLNITAHWIHI
jgi:hypothetical protein